MRRFLLALVAALYFAGDPTPAFAETHRQGFVIDVDLATRRVWIAPPGWAPPMLKPPPVVVEEPVADELLWAWEHDNPPRLIDLVEYDDNGVYDGWSYVIP